MSLRFVHYHTSFVARCKYDSDTLVQCTIKYKTVRMINMMHYHYMYVHILQVTVFNIHTFVAYCIPLPVINPMEFPEAMHDRDF